MTEVFIKDRIDDHTVILEVKWTAENGDFVAALVKVAADLDDISREDPTIPPHVRARAIYAARELVRQFHEASDQDV